MNTKPIIFQDAMVRALLEGRKTQTRRVVKPQPWKELNEGINPYLRGTWCWADVRKDGMVRDAEMAHVAREGLARALAIRCPYGQPGDLLYVREAWGVFKPWGSGKVTYLVKGRMPDEPDDLNEPSWMVDYRERNELDMPMKGPWRSPIHMPRLASRLTLRLTDVRVERVRDMEAMGDEAAMVEGVDPLAYGVDPLQRGAYLEAFRRLWDSINAAKGYGWDSNPWVWVLEFEVIQANVDEVLRRQEVAPA